MMPGRETEEKRQHSTVLVPYSYYECQIPEHFRNVPMHWHSEFEINYIFGGEGKFICGNEKLYAREGDILILPPNMLHSAYPHENGILAYQALVFNQVMLGANTNDRCTTECIRPLVNGTLKIRTLISPEAKNYPCLRASADQIFSCVTGKRPKTHKDCPAHAWGQFAEKESVDYAEGVFVGYRYLDAYEVEPEFCFGHGLSYTAFEYQGAKLVRENERFYVDCRVCNTGEMEGKETIQVYLAPKDRTRDEPVQQLKGFEKVSLKPGESRLVRVEIEDYREDMRVRVGSSLKDIRLEIIDRIAKGVE